MIKEINVNIFKGSSDISISKRISKLFPAALDFYGEKYKEILLQAINDNIFYELSTNENVIEVIEKLSGKKFSDEEKSSNIGGATINLTISGKKRTVIIVKDLPYYDLDNTLAHELFGHAVCRIQNPIVQIDGKDYKRDGVSLIPTTNEGKNRGEGINEGCMDFIAEQILKRATKNPLYCLNSQRLYKTSTDFAEYLFSCLGKELMLEILVENKLFLDEILKSDFQYLDGYLNLFHITQDFQYLKPISIFIESIKNNLGKGKNEKPLKDSKILTDIMAAKQALSSIIDKIPIDFISATRKMVESGELSIDDIERIKNVIKIAETTNVSYIEYVGKAIFGDSFDISNFSDGLNV
ncbi:MAG: hypothetical protein IJX26_03750 [Clostridia bacterium]|nr:hypothetical protein [Clostridia bacterium]